MDAASGRVTDDPLWVEIQDENGTFSGRRALGTAPLRIGRAWDNDIVLTDPWAAPYHAELRRDETGQWRIHDLDSRNGLRAAKRGRRQREIALLPGASCFIGRSRLRLQSLSASLEPELPLHRSRLPWPSALAWTLIALLTLIGLGWLRSSQPFDWEDTLETISSDLVVNGIWAFLWTGLTRLDWFGTFLRHWRIGAVMMTVLRIVFFLFPLLAYALAWTSIIRFEGLVIWLILALFIVLTRHFSKRRSAVPVVVLGFVILLAVTTTLVPALRTPKSNASAAALEQLYPPALRLAPTHTPDAFFDAVAALEPELEQRHAAAAAARAEREAAHPAEDDSRPRLRPRQQTEAAEPGGREERPEADDAPAGEPDEEAGAAGAGRLPLEGDEELGDEQPFGGR
ncbi:MAG TPA: FHA domain-containing protein, partial [Vicinamibacterales bacterium]|nr:FHA domain-containing protein [Vicinamibacterales bacterium]